MFVIPHRSGRHVVPSAAVVLRSCCFFLAFVAFGLLLLLAIAPLAFMAPSNGAGKARPARKDDWDCTGCSFKRNFGWRTHCWACNKKAPPGKGKSFRDAAASGARVAGGSGQPAGGSAAGAGQKGEGNSQGSFLQALVAFKAEEGGPPQEAMQAIASWAQSQLDKEKADKTATKPLEVRHRGVERDLAHKKRTTEAAGAAVTKAEAELERAKVALEQARKAHQDRKSELEKIEKLRSDILSEMAVEGIRPDSACDAGWKAEAVAKVWGIQADDIDKAGMREEIEQIDKLIGSLRGKATTWRDAAAQKGGAPAAEVKAPDVKQGDGDDEMELDEAEFEKLAGAICDPDLGLPDGVRDAQRRKLRETWENSAKKKIRRTEGS